MHKNITAILLASTVILALLVSCGRSSTTLFSTISSTEEAVAGNTASTGVETNVGTTTSAMTVTSALAENSPNHEDAADYQWENTNMIPITLQGDLISVDGDGATVDGSTVTITAAGTYSLSGSLADGQIAVDTDDEEVVWLILNGINVHNSTSAALNVIEAEKVVIVLADQTENYLSDGETYLFADPDEDEPNATLFSKADLTLYGNGSLTVDANYNDGIASKDGLIIASGTTTVNAVDDGIRGKDYLVVKAGNLIVNAQGDGLKSDEEEDATKGYIAIETGVIQITAGGDAITAESDVVIIDGEFVLATGGGSNSRIAEDLSAKGIKAAVAVAIDGGAFTIDSADDAIHSNAALAINGGAFTLATGDDAIHADATIVINGGDIQIPQSYEGIESAVITINDGNIHLVASDDGVNVAGGNDSSGTNRGPRGPRGGQDNFTYSGSEYLYLNGGYLMVDAGGDGLDVNGAVEMTGGIVIVNGPTMRMNSALDYDALFKMTGGFVVAAGSSGMAQAPGAVSTQPSVLINFTATQPAGTLIHLQSSDGEALLTFAPTKEYQSVAFSSPALVTGSTYTVYVGGTTTGAAQDGLYPEGSYTPGTEYTTFTVNDIVTMIGTNRR